jgi:hypothetical protein
VSFLINFCGVDKEQALSSTLVYHLIITTPHTLIILIYMTKSFWKEVRI